MKRSIFFLVLITQSIHLICQSLAHKPLDASGQTTVITVVPVKPLSRKKLKQELGGVAKDLFTATADFVSRAGGFFVSGAAEKTVGLLQKKSSTVSEGNQKAIGLMLGHVSHVQKICAALAEALLDDAPQIAKAKKVDLATSLATLQELQKAFSKNVFQAGAKAVLAEHEAELNKLVERAKKDACLRLA